MKTPDNTQPDINEQHVYQNKYTTNK